VNKRIRYFYGIVAGTIGAVLSPLVALAGDVGKSTSNTAFKDFATSYSFQGVTDVYYQAPWLVSFVQFFISWCCIIAFVVYFFSYLCSIVVLSNKELFYTIDALKKDKGSEENTGIFKTVFDGFKRGASDSGLNGGFDNIAVFFFKLSLNFKAYSVYKNVEPGSEDGGKTSWGGGYSYNDTIASFFLKSLFQAVAVTVICSTALSGVLIRTWFTIGDVIIVKMDRFANTTLVAKLDEVLGNDGLYTFNLASSGTKGGAIAEQVARKLYANIVSYFPDITNDQAQAIGRETENKIEDLILGNTATGYDTIKDLVNKTLPDDYKVETLNTEELMQGVELKAFNVNSNDSTNGDTQLVISLKEIVDNAQLQVPAGRADINKWAHVTLIWNAGAGRSHMVDQNAPSQTQTTTTNPNVIE
jgi:hypothetical protein